MGALTLLRKGSQGAKTPSPLAGGGNRGNHASWTGRWEAPLLSPHRALLRPRGLLYNLQSSGAQKAPLPGRPDQHWQSCQVAELSPWSTDMWRPHTDLQGFGERDSIFIKLEATGLTPQSSLMFVGWLEGDLAVLGETRQGQRTLSIGTGPWGTATLPWPVLPPPRLGPMLRASSWCRLYLVTGAWHLPKGQRQREGPPCAIRS